MQKRNKKVYFLSSILKTECLKSRTSKMWLLKVLYIFVHNISNISLSEVSFHFTAFQHLERSLFLKELLLLHFYYISKIDFDLQAVRCTIWLEGFFKYALIKTFKASREEFRENKHKECSTSTQATDMQPPSQILLHNFRNFLSVLLLVTDGLCNSRKKTVYFG